MRKTAITLIFYVAMAAAAPAFADSPDGPPPPPPHCGPEGPGDLGGPGHHDPMRLAGMLSAMETGVGVQVNQMEAWRQYTDALQAVLRPPTPPAPSAPGSKGPTAFLHSTVIAMDTIDKAKKAEALLAAIDNLRKTLTAEQLERVKLLEPHPPHCGPIPSFALPK